MGLPPSQILAAAIKCRMSGRISSLVLGLLEHLTFLYDAVIIIRTVSIDTKLIIHSFSLYFPSVPCDNMYISFIILSAHAHQH